MENNKKGKLAGDNMPSERLYINWRTREIVIMTPADFNLKPSIFRKIYEDEGPLSDHRERGNPDKRIDTIST